MMDHREAVARLLALWLEQREDQTPVSALVNRATIERVKRRDLLREDDGFCAYPAPRAKPKLRLIQGGLR
jgi:hypothetical protein